MSAEDANEAVKTLNGKDLLGRNLKLEIAARKGTKLDGSAKRRKKSAAAEEPAPAEESDAAGEAENQIEDDKPAKKRQRAQEDAAEETAVAPVAKKPKEIGAAGAGKELPRGPRTVIISGIPEGATKNNLKHRVKKACHIARLRVADWSNPRAGISCREHHHRTCLIRKSLHISLAVSLYRCQGCR